MDNPIDNFWKLRLEDLKEVLEGNNFDVFIADSLEAAKELVLEDLIPKLQPKSISWGGSITFVATGLYNELKDNQEMKVLDTFDKNLSAEDMMELRRQSLLVDLFITGTNAVTEDGMLVNLDMIGNRTGAISFGPKNVILCVGRNKVVPDMESAMLRIKNYSAPTNVMRLDKKTPCSKTSFCEDCTSPDRICNTWAILEKSFPKKRIKIVLINKDSGL